MCDAEIAHPAYKEKKWSVTSHEIVGMLRNLVLAIQCCPKKSYKAVDFIERFKLKDF